MSGGRQRRAARKLEKAVANHIGPRAPKVALVLAVVAAAALVARALGVW